MVAKTNGKGFLRGIIERIRPTQSTKRVAHSLYDDELLEAFRDEYYGFRRLRGSVYLQDIMPLDKVYLSRVARALFYTSAIARKVVLTPIIWYYAGGLRILSNNKKLNRICQQFVKDWGQHLHDMLITFMLDGELVVPILTLRNRLLEFGYVDGLNVVEVQFDQTNPLFPQTIKYTVQRMDAASAVPLTSDIREVQVLRNNRFDDILYNSDRNYCLYFRANNLPSYRGRSFIEQLVDIIYNTENFIQDILIQNQLMGAVLWDVTMTGASKEEVDSRQAELIRTPPPPGSFVVHNENEQWQLVEKQYHGEGQRIDADIMLRHIALGSFYDLDWMGVQTNEQTYFQTTKTFEYLFNLFNTIISDMLRVYIIAHQRAGLLPKSADPDDFKIYNGSQNILLFKQTAITFAQLANGMKVATDNGWVEEETAKRILHDALNITVDEVTTKKTVSTQEIYNIVNTLIAVYNMGVLDDKQLKDTLAYYLDRSQVEIKGGIQSNPLGMAPTPQTGLTGEKVEPSGGPNAQGL